LEKDLKTMTFSYLSGRFPEAEVTEVGVGLVDHQQPSEALGYGLHDLLRLLGAGGVVRGCHEYDLGALGPLEELLDVYREALVHVEALGYTSKGLDVEPVHLEGRLNDHGPALADEALRYEVYYRVAPVLDYYVPLGDA
jgi:hypothetical protein